jgi:hypothetical protein
MTDATHAYVGIADCGCLQAAAVDSPDRKQEVRKEVMSMMKWGTIERMPIETARMRLCLGKHPKNVCPHPQACPEGATT